MRQRILWSNAKLPTTTEFPALRLAVALRRSLGRALALAGALFAVACSHPQRTWVVCYAQDVPADALAQFDLIVVDSAWPGKVAALKQTRSTALAYISLGELNEQRAEFAKAKAAGLLVMENPNWKGAWLVDVRDERWHAMIADELAAALLARGFDGFFLDTVDSSLHLEETDPQHYAGMKAGVEKLIARLHRTHPQAKLLLNGALAVAADQPDAVQMVAMESSLTDWDFATKKARWRTSDEREWVMNRVRTARAANPKLAVYTLDYWDPADLPGIAAIYKQQRADGFVPYVATLALDRVMPEPRVDQEKIPKHPLFGASH